MQWYSLHLGCPYPIDVFVDFWYDDGLWCEFCIALAGCGLDVIGGEVQMIVGCVRLDLKF